MAEQDAHGGKVLKKNGHKGKKKRKNEKGSL